MARARIAGRVAKAKARATYKWGLKKPKKRVLKAYATKVGQVTFKTVKRSKRKPMMRMSRRC